MVKKLELKAKYFMYEVVKEGNWWNGPRYEGENTLIERLNEWVDEMQDTAPGFRIVNVEHLIDVRGENARTDDAGRCVWYTVDR